jgi:hypothetical protein
MNNRKIEQKLDDIANRLSRIEDTLEKSQIKPARATRKTKTEENVPHGDSNIASDLSEIMTE